MTESVERVVSAVHLEDLQDRVAGSPVYKELQHYADALRTYITSTYHISNPALVELRDELLKREGAIAQRPYIESTARYAASRRYADLSIPTTSRPAHVARWARGRLRPALRPPGERAGVRARDGIPRSRRHDWDWLR